MKMILNNKNDFDFPWVTTTGGESVCVKVRPLTGDSHTESTPSFSDQRIPTAEWGFKTHCSIRGTC